MRKSPEVERRVLVIVGDKNTRPGAEQEISEFAYQLGFRAVSAGFIKPIEELEKVNGELENPDEESEETIKLSEEEKQQLLDEHIDRTWPTGPEDYIGKEHFQRLGRVLKINRLAMGILFNNLFYPLQRDNHDEPIMPRDLGLTVMHRSFTTIPDVAHLMPKNIRSPKDRLPGAYRVHKNYALENRLAKVPDVLDAVQKVGGIVELPDHHYFNYAHMGDRTRERLKVVSNYFRDESHYRKR